MESTSYFCEILIKLNSWQQINEIKNNLYLYTIRFYNIFVSAINEHKCKRDANIRKDNSVQWIWISFTWYHGEVCYLAWEGTFAADTLRLVDSSAYTSAEMISWHK